MVRLSLFTAITMNYSHLTPQELEDTLKDMEELQSDLDGGNERTIKLVEQLKTMLLAANASSWHFSLIIHD